MERLIGVVTIALLINPSLQRGAFVGRSGSFTVSSSKELVKTRPGSNISAELSDIQVHAGASIKIRDGRSGTFMYDSLGNGRFRTYKIGNEVDAKNVSAPIRIVSTTKKLVFTPVGFSPSDRFQVQYLADKFSDGCPVAELDEGSRTCNTERLNPRATSCEIIKNCGEHRRQDGTRKVCSDENEWIGDVGCKLNSDTVLSEICMINFEESDQVPDECPFKTEEVIDFYLAEEGTDPDIEAGRSGRGAPPICNRRVCNRRFGKRRRTPGWMNFLKCYFGGRCHRLYGIGRTFLK